MDVVPNSWNGSSVDSLISKFDLCSKAIACHGFLQQIAQM